MISSPRLIALLPALALSVGMLLAAHAGQPAASNSTKERKLRAADVFHRSGAVLFQDDFQSGTLDRWNISENDQYQLDAPTPERLKVVAAPGLPDGRKAVRMVVERAPNSFRSEISLPHEKGFQERWYAGKILIPEEWVFDPVRGDDIVMQWHAIPGNGKATFPNLAISVQNDQWFIKQRFGSAHEGPTRKDLKLDEPVRRGAWVAWVIHAKWSPKNDGLLQVWRDGKLVLERLGPNVYGDIGLEYTPYLKTGIYHPTWHLDDEESRAAFEKAKPVALRKIVYVTDIKVGDARMTLETISSKP